MGLLSIASNTVGNVVGDALSGYGAYKGAKAAGKQIKKGMEENETMSDAVRQTLFHFIRHTLLKGNPHYQT